MSEYVPRQHTGKPQGSNHRIISANVELWEDEPPQFIVLGRYRYVFLSCEDKENRNVEHKSCKKLRQKKC